MRPPQTEAEQYQQVARRVHGAPPERRWHVLRCCVERVGTRYSHAVLTQVYLEVLARQAQLPASPVPPAWQLGVDAAGCPKESINRSEERGRARLTFVSQPEYQRLIRKYEFLMACVIGNACEQPRAVELRHSRCSDSIVEAVRG
jgi:hypothetical protein